MPKITNIFTWMSINNTPVKISSQINDYFSSSMKRLEILSGHLKKINKHMMTRTFLYAEDF